MGRQLASGGECVLSYTPSLYSIINLPHHFLILASGDGTLDGNMIHNEILWDLGSAKLSQIHELTCMLWQFTQDQYTIALYCG